MRLCLFQWGDCRLTRLWSDHRVWLCLCVEKIRAPYAVSKPALYLSWRAISAQISYDRIIVLLSRTRTQQRVRLARILLVHNKLLLPKCPQQVGAPLQQNTQTRSTDIVRLASSVGRLPESPTFRRDQDATHPRLPRRPWPEFGGLARRIYCTEHSSQ